MKNLNFKTNIGIFGNKQLIQFIGLYKGDGLTSIKSKTSKGTFSFGNTNLTLNNFIIQILEIIFNINRKNLKFQVQINNQSKIDEGIDYWSTSLALPKNNFRKTMINKNQRSEHGLLSIIYENKEFKKYFMDLLNKTKELSKNNKEAAIEYLKGVIASDGDIGLEKGSLNRVRISGTTLKDLKHYQRVLKQLNISSSINEEHRLQISHWSNFFKIAFFDLVTLHPKKRQDFLNGFKNNYRLKHFNNLIYFKNRTITIKDYQKLINKKYNTTAIRQLKNLLELNLVARKKDEVFKYNLLKNGEILLANLKNEGTEF